MNKEAQRIAIAEACGWTDIISEWCGAGKDQRKILCGDKAGSFTRIIPDYLTDLNAMHEAEKVLKDERKPAYRDFLVSIVGRDTPKNQKFFSWWNATAAQRAEALLRTLNLWTPSP